MIKIVDYETISYNAIKQLNIQNLVIKQLNI